MMLVPRRNSFDLFDDLFDEDFFNDKKERNLMKTDIRETKNKYLVDVDLPGFKKENIKLSLNNGYLNISAKVDKNNDDKNEKFVRRERFHGECSRSFYVGDEIKEKDIEAEFKDGTLKVQIPRKDELDHKNEIKQIDIK